MRIVGVILFLSAFAYTSLTTHGASAFSGVTWDGKTWLKAAAVLFFVAFIGIPSFGIRQLFFGSSWFVATDERIVVTKKGKVFSLPWPDLTGQTRLVRKGRYWNLGIEIKGSSKFEHLETLELKGLSDGPRVEALLREMAVQEHEIPNSVATAQG